MTQLPPKRSSSNTSLFIGAWLGLTLVAGLGVFALIYWALGGFVAGGSPNVPATAVVAVQPSATPITASTDATPVPPVCDYPALPPSGFGYGIQSHAFEGDPDFWFSVITDKLHLQWLKIQVRWDQMEGVRGDVYWNDMDRVIKAACQRRLRVMLSVVTAPAWAHASPMPAPKGEAAPPDDPAMYAEFVGRIIERYPGRIQAIEVWNEQNLDREWNTPAGVNPADYLKLLQAAYAAIKSRDAGITVIAGALSPTGANCNVGPYPTNCQPSGRPIVVDDVTYLKAFIAAGGLQYADCIGTHSNGTNLPPLSDGAHPPGDGTGYTFLGPWKSPHYSWALKSQVETYAALLPTGKKQCVTEFGYASPLDGKYPPGFDYAADVSETQQAQYLVEAFDWMRDSGLVQMAFLWNLDYAPKGGDPATNDNVIFSIMKADGVRPAFDAIAAMPKP